METCHLLLTHYTDTQLRHIC